MEVAEAVSQQESCQHSPNRPNSQPQVLHVPAAGALGTEPKMACLYSQYLPAGPTAWLRLACSQSYLSSKGAAAYPSLAQFQPSCELVGVMVQPVLDCPLSWLSLVPVCTVYQSFPAYLPDPAHTYANGYCNPVWSGLPLALTDALTSGKLCLSG